MRGPAWRCDAIPPRPQTTGMLRFGKWYAMQSHTSTAPSPVPATRHAASMLYFKQRTASGGVVVWERIGYGAAAQRAAGLRPDSQAAPAARSRRVPGAAGPGPRVACGAQPRVAGYGAAGGPCLGGRAPRRAGRT